MDFYFHNIKVCWDIKHEYCKLSNNVDRYQNWYLIMYNYLKWQWIRKLYSLIYFSNPKLHYPHCHPILPHRIPCYLLSQSALHYCLFITMCSVLSCFSYDWPFVTRWTVAHQASLSMGSFRQEHWNGLPCSPPGDLPNPATELTSLMYPALAGGFFTTSVT